MAGGKSFAQRLYTGDLSYDFVNRRKRWYLISVVLILICFASLAFRGLNLGIEFKGGATFQAPIKVTAQTIPTVRQAVLATNLPDLDDTNIVTLGNNQVQVQTRVLGDDEGPTIQAAIAKAVGVTPAQVTTSRIGASWGQQITNKALLALGVFLVLVTLMIWAYFRDFKMSIAAMVALAHDLVLTVGVYSLVGFAVTPATLIGVLTILGYSLYDTVVVFDKVRENVKNITSQNRTYSDGANLAVNQVLVRSINTTLIGVLPVAALLFAGAVVLKTGPLEDLGLALFVGMISGAYSSVFIATPLLAQLREREPAMRAHRRAIERRAIRGGRTRTSSTS